jgi:hypothetical protein
MGGLVSTSAGSWQLLDATAPVPSLPPALRAAAALASAVVLGVATERAPRRYALPR